MLFNCALTNISIFRELLRLIKAFFMGQQKQAPLSTIKTTRIQKLLQILGMTIKEFVMRHAEFEIVNQNNQDVLFMVPAANIQHPLYKKNLETIPLKIQQTSQSIMANPPVNQEKKISHDISTTNNIEFKNAIEGDSSIKWVRTAAEAQYIQEYSSTISIVAIDAEYQNETICLIQIFAGNITYLFDVYVKHSDRIELTRCLRYLMQNPAVKKVFHDSRQDLFYLNKLGVDNINSLVDTQVLYQMNQELKKSQEKRIGLGPLLRMYGFDHKLKEQVHREMEEGKIDWSKRPLDERLIKYAAEDVSYLIQLYQKLEEERQQLTQEIYKAYSSSLLTSKDLTIQKQTYLERAAVKPNEKYQLVFSSDIKANYYTKETINNTNIKGNFYSFNKLMVTNYKFLGHNPNNTNHRNNDEFDELIETLPPNIQAEVTRIIQSEDKQVIEIIVDYAKPVCLRFEDRSEKNIQITADNLEAFITNLRDKTNTDFRRDNRMGMEVRQITL